MKFIKEKPERLFLFVILLIAAVMRFYNISTLSLSNDELSLITRIREYTFGDFFSLENLSTETAGYYSFFYLWVKLAGSSVFLIKIPFVISGILCVLFIYRIGEKWFNVQGALFAATCGSFLQFPLLYSQVSGPLGPGFLFVLVAVWYWTKIFSENISMKRDFILLTLFASLAAWMNYFAWAFVLLVLVTGFFLIKREILKKYIIVSIVFVLLSLINLPVLLHQLSSPAPGWLEEPGQGWVFEHIQYIFNDSSLILYLVLAIFVVSNITAFSEIKFGKFHSISIVWFVVPVLYGFYYSVLIKPVLENSVLIFSFPFLLLFFFSFIRNVSRITNFMVLAMLLATGIYSSTCEKKYYSTPHFGEFRDIAEKSIAWSEKYGEENITYTININSPSYINYYLNLFEHPLNFELYKNDGKEDLKKLRLVIDSCNTNYFLYAWSSVYNPAETDAMIRVCFPYIIEEMKYGDMAAISLYSNMPGAEVIPVTEPLTYIFNDFEDKNAWCDDTSVNSSENVKYGKYAVRIDSNEYGPASTATISELSEKPFSRIDISLWAFSEESLRDAQLVVAIDFADKSNEVYENYFWRSTKFEYFLDKEKWGQVFFSVQLPELQSRNDQLKIYVWNPARQTLFVDNFEIKIFE